MRIYNLQIRQEHDDVRIEVSIDSARSGNQSLWFSTPKKYEHCLCKTRLDGFLVGLLFLAMQNGEDIYVDGCVSEKLLFNLNNYIIPLLASFSPSCGLINITAKETSAEPLNGTGVGTGFSGGIDSFCTIYDRFELESLPNYKINSFLFLNVGSHGPGHQEEDLVFARMKFQKRYAYLKKYTDEVGLEFIPLDSNLHRFHPWGHLKTVTLTSAAGILVLQGHFNRYYYASAGFSYNEYIEKGWTFRDGNVADYCDPIMVPLLSTESMEFVLDGMQYTRVEKTKHVIAYEPVQRYLNVCVGGRSTDTWENCSVCGKCCRTLMTLTSLGKLDSFSHLFDIEKYKTNAEWKYLCRQVFIGKKNPFAWNNIKLATEAGVRLPSPFTSYLVFMSDCVRRCVSRRLKKMLLPLLSFKIGRSG